MPWVGASDAMNSEHMTDHLSHPCHRRQIATGMIALALAGCSSMAPHTTIPALPIAQAWPESAAPATNEGAAAHTLPWRDYFADPPLASLIETALTNSRDLRLALLRVEEARAL